MYSPKRLSKALIGSDTVRQRITVIFCPRFVTSFSRQAMYWLKIAIFHQKIHASFEGEPVRIRYDRHTEFSYVEWKHCILFRVKTLYNVVTSRPAMNSLITMFSRFDRIPAGNRGTDILTEHSPRYVYASCGKNHTAYELILCWAVCPTLLGVFGISSTTLNTGCQEEQDIKKMMETYF